MGLAVYSFLLLTGLGMSAPWWLWRMVRDGRYREGLGERLGRISRGLLDAVRGKRVIWVHAVSVGEVLAAALLAGELGVALNGREQPCDNSLVSPRSNHGAPWVVVVSTTTATGQKVARERFGAARVFYFPLDFGWVVRRYLRALQPELVVLVESELWPRLLGECERAGVPVAVVNARVSDRSFARAMRVRRVWGWMGRKVGLWLAQGEESAGRLRELGVEARRVRVTGNLKYDSRKPERNDVAEWVQAVADGRRVIVAGSTLAGRSAQALSEEEMIIEAWEGWAREQGVVLVLAPRHPERFAEATVAASEFRFCKATTMRALQGTTLPLAGAGSEVIVLDTLGDLAAVYGVADVAFVGGSLVGKGGHNPLEAARFGVPVVMGPSYENFREIVEGMRAADAIRIVDAKGVDGALVELLNDGRGMGERGRAFYEGQAGATGRTVDALVELIHA